MSDKEKELIQNQDELSNEQLSNDDSQELDITASDIQLDLPQHDGESEWEFDGEAPTIDGNITLDNGIEFEVPQQLAPQPSQPEAYAKTSKSKKGDLTSFILTSVIAVLVAVLLGLLGCRYYTTPNTEEKMNPGNIALVVGDTPVSIGMYNYCYTNLSNQIISSGLVDTSIPYDQQTTTGTNGDEVTFEQYFKEVTIAYLKEVTSYYEAGVEAGITLTETNKETIQTQLDYVKESAASNGDQGINAFIQENYGEYCGYATLEKMLEQHMIASQYQQKIKTDITYTDEELQTFFNENSDDYYETPMAYAFMYFDETNREDVIATAKSYADQINSLTDLKQLVPVIYKDMISQYVEYGYYESADECALEIAQTLEVSITSEDTSFGSDVPNWLFADTTKVNDCTYIIDEDSDVVFLVIKTGETTLNKETVYSVRHILIMPEATAEQQTAANSGEDVVYTDEQKAAAKAKAEEIIEEYNNTDKTEFDFALLAEKYSEDVESTSNGSSGLYGGFYDGVHIGEMVTSFENWCIDDSRKYGDIDIVESDYGYHIMYFVDCGESYLHDCKNALIVDKVIKIMDEYQVKEYKRGIAKTVVAEYQSQDAE